jgi:L-ribulokinase
MAIIAGVDFDTLSVRVTLFDSEKARLTTAIAEYPLHRKREDPDYATQAHEDRMNALVKGTHDVLRQTGVARQDVIAMALDTTGSSVVIVDDRLDPPDGYYLWCDHPASRSTRCCPEAPRLPACCLPLS